MRKILAMIVAVCLMMSLAIPAFATETTGTTETTTASTETTSASSETTGASEETTGATEDTGTETTGAAAADEHDHDHDHSDETTGETEEEESTFKKVLRVIVIVLEVISGVALTVIILLQSGKEAGLSSALSGNSDSYMSKNGKGNLDKTLAKATKWVALAFLALTLLLSIIGY